MRKQLTTIYIVLSLIIIVFSTVSLPESALAQTPPPVTGDWVVADTTLINDTTVFLDGNLTVTTAGTLTLRNVTLQLNCSENRTLGIEVEGSLLGSKGRLNVYNCTIEASNSTFYYNFTVNGRMTMRDSTVKNVGGFINLLDPLNSLGGIQLGGPDILIEGTNITDYESIGVSVLPLASPTIEYCNISMPVNLSALGFTIGIVDSSAGFTSPVYRGNRISGNLLSGIVSIGLPVGTTFADIQENTFESNTVGVTCFGTSPDITDNVFNGNLLGGIGLMDSDSDISGNEITVSGSAISVLNPCDPHIHHNTINFSAIGILLANGTACTINNNNISENLVYGISATGADPEVYENDMHNNLLTAIYLDDSEALVHNNRIHSIILGTGIRVMNDSAPQIYQNDIYGGDLSTGIVLSGNVSLSPSLYQNEFFLGDGTTAMNVDGFSPIINDNSIGMGSGSRGVDAVGSSVTMHGNSIFGANDSIALEVLSSGVLAANNSMSNLEMGVFGTNVTITLKDNYFENTTDVGVFLDTCPGVDLRSNTYSYVHGNTGAMRFKEAEIINSTNVLVNEKDGYTRILNSSIVSLAVDSTGIGLIQVDWFLDVEVDMPDGSPGGNMTVVLENTTGAPRGTLTTDDQGWTRWNQVTEKVVQADGTVFHSPLDVSVKHPPWEDNETVVLDRSKEVHLKLGFNTGPSAPFNLTPQATHNRTPLLRWDPSTDPNEDPITYTISIGTAIHGTDVIDSVNTTFPSFQIPAPLEFTTYFVELTAYTPDGNNSTPLVNDIQIVNSPPALQNLKDRVLYLEDSPVLHILLNASDPDTDPVDLLTYGTNTTLFTVNATSGVVNWTPTASDLGTHLVNFTVSDGFAGDFQEVLITIAYRNRAPVADAGEDFNGTVGELIRLNGTASSDPDGDAITYQWKPDKLVFLNISDPSRPWFKVDEPGNYSFTLIVKDVYGLESPGDQVVVRVLEAEPEEPILKPEFVLKFGKVTPLEGTVNDTFTFSVVLFGKNISQEIINRFNNTAVVDVKFEGARKVFSLLRQSDTIDLINGVLYALTISGEDLGVGNHTHQFNCFFDNTTGDVGIFQGPRVTEVSADDDVVDDDVVDDDDDTEEQSSMTICLLLLLIGLIFIVVVIIIIVAVWKQRTEAAGDVDEDDEDEGDGFDDEDFEDNEFDDDDFFDDFLDEDGNDEPGGSSGRQSRMASDNIDFDDDEGFFDDDDLDDDDFLE